MWRADAIDHPDIVGEAYFDTDTHEYLVIVMRGAERKEKRFHALYDPRFGIDVSDYQEIINVATQLSDELVAEKEEQDDAGKEGKIAT